MVDIRHLSSVEAAQLQGQRYDRVLNFGPNEFSVLQKAARAAVDYCNLTCLTPFSADVNIANKSEDVTGLYTTQTSMDKYAETLEDFADGMRGVSPTQAESDVARQLAEMIRFGGEVFDSLQIDNLRPEQFHSR